MENGFVLNRSTSPTVSPLGNFEPALHLRADVGDLIEIDRKIYTQWAIYLGEGRVIYVAGEKADFPTNGEARVRKSTLTAVAKGCLVRVNNKMVPANKRGLLPLDATVVVENARRQIGRRLEFNLFEKNSEHYATLWKFGRGWSDQADTAHKVMSIFKSQQPKKLPCSRHSAPGSLHAMVTGLAAIFHTGGGPRLTANTPGGGGGLTSNRVRRQNTQ